MICNICGKEVPDGMRFCSNCGSPIEAPAQPAAPVQPVAPVQPAVPVQPVAPVQPAAPVQPVAPVQQAAPSVKQKTSLPVELPVILAGAAPLVAAIAVGIISTILNLIINEIFGYTEFGMRFTQIIYIVLRLAVMVGFTFVACKDIKDKIAFVSVGYAGQSLGDIVYSFVNIVIVILSGNPYNGVASFISGALGTVAGCLISAGAYYVYKNGLKIKK